jgi:NTP pyrophosphatase (non-canonical NTP hydrolase)
MDKRVKEMETMNIKELCKKSHKISLDKGFWEDGRSNAECLMLIVTELGEACEWDRKGDKSHFNEEIADTFIRLGDLCEWLCIDIEKEIKEKMEKNKKRPYKHGKMY